MTNKTKKTKTAKSTKTSTCKSCCCSWMTAAKALVIAISFRILLSTAPGSQPDWDYDHDEWAFKLKQQQLQHQSHYVSSSLSGDDGGDLRLDNVEIVRFLGGDGSTELVGHLYRPPHHHLKKEERDDDSALTPVIVLGHGLGLTQDSALTPFVDAFTEAGFAAFTFDYATFGASGGLPRHVVHPNHHIADIEAAIQMIRDRGHSEGIDVNRIGLWGPSLGGGHALVVAANHARNNEKKNKKFKNKNKNIYGYHVVAEDARTMNMNMNGDDDDDDDEEDYLKAVVVLVPHVTSGAEMVAWRFDRNSAAGLLKITHAMIKWAAVSTWSIFTELNSDHREKSSSWYVPLVGAPGSAAFLQNPGDEEGYSALIPSGNSNMYGWKNAVTIPSALRLLVYRPLGTLDSLQQNDESNIKVTPIMMIAAENDTACPLKSIERAFELISSKTSESEEKRKLVVLKDAGHFDVYNEGNVLQQVLTTTVEFFVKHL